MTNLNTRRNKYDWDLIDSWRYGEDLSYMDIIAKHKKMFGYAPVRSTLSNRYGEGVAEKAKIRKSKIVDTPMYRLSRKLDRFKHKKESKVFKPTKDEYLTSEWDRFRDKLKKFRNKGVGNMQTWTSQDVVDKFWPNGISKCGNKFPFIECYLTGEVINVSATTTHCDHIDPNGGNGLDNLAFTTKDANQMKSYLHMDDWCQKAKIMVERHEARSSSG